MRLFDASITLCIQNFQIATFILSDLKWVDCVTGGHVRNRKRSSIGHWKTWRITCGAMHQGLLRHKLASHSGCLIYEIPSLFNFWASPIQLVLTKMWMLIRLLLQFIAGRLQRHWSR